MTGDAGPGPSDEPRNGGQPHDGSVFEGDWLALRESVDHRSRASELLPPLIHAWRRRRWRRIADLGSGTGSNLRYLAPRLPTPQSWVLVDHDEKLLDQVAIPSEVEGVERVCGDLAHEGIEALRGVDLVTGAALLDLVSEEWLERVVQVCAAQECGALFTTVYDGTIAWTPGSAPAGEAGAPSEAGHGHADDEWVRTLVNTHQGRDKGLGPALGPRAAQDARARFGAAGYRTWLVPSPWRLGAADEALAFALLDGWAAAALEERPSANDRVRRWIDRGRARVREGRAVLTVGHLDLLALPGRESRTTGGA